PAGPSSRASNLTTSPDGETYLSWIEVSDSGTAALKFAVRTADAWSQPKTITQSDGLIVNEADFPSMVALGKGLLGAHWMLTLPEGGEAWNIQIAVSNDAGQTWSKPVVPHRDGTPTEHGFVSLVPAPKGGIAAVWLDSRNAGKSDEVTLMYAPIATNG